jgi:predicted transposase YbfD/YdcC
MEIQLARRSYVEFREFDREYLFEEDFPMADAPDFVAHFSILADPRLERTKKHRLIDILFIAVCALICGGEGFTDMELFGEAKEAWLRGLLELPHGIPSHDTFRRVFCLLDAPPFGECFMRWSAALHAATKGEVIALDGKTLRHSFDRAAGQPALHLISAWASANGLALGQLKVDGKSNEITALPALLKLLDVKDRVVTMDAMGCQRELASQIIEQGGDYVFCLKGNQESLHDEVRDFFEQAHAGAWQGVVHSSHETVEKDHGRIEIRRCWMVAEQAVAWLDRGEQWAGLASIAAVEAEWRSGEQVTRETRYFISSLRGSARQRAEAIREHWAIENSLHHVLDVTMNEDASRLRSDHAAENLATLRRIALNLIRQAKGPKSSVRRRIKKAGWDNAFLEAIIVN